MAMSNEHQPTTVLRRRITDLARTGIPQYLIAKVIGMAPETLRKHYERELELAEAEAIERVGNTVIEQALDGNEKSQALYLKTRGAKFGWVEKQVIEKVESAEMQELKDKITEIESKYERDY